MQEGRRARHPRTSPHRPYSVRRSRSLLASTSVDKRSIDSKRPDQHRTPSLRLQGNQRAPTASLPLAAVQQGLVANRSTRQGTTGLAERTSTKRGAGSLKREIGDIAKPVPWTTNCLLARPAGGLPSSDSTRRLLPNLPLECRPQTLSPRYPPQRRQLHHLPTSIRVRPLSPQVPSNFLPRRSDPAYPITRPPQPGTLFSLERRDPQPLHHLRRFLSPLRFQPLKITRYPLLALLRLCLLYLPGKTIPRPHSCRSRRKSRTRFLEGRTIQSDLPKPLVRRKLRRRRPPGRTFSHERPAQHLRHTSDPLNSPSRRSRSRKLPLLRSPASEGRK